LTLLGRDAGDGSLPHSQCAAMGGGDPVHAGFPNSLYRGFGLFPSSCFTIGLLNPLYLAQCFSFTTSF